MGYISEKSDVDKSAKLGKNVYIASFASIRADEGEVVIGEGSNVQESCVLHGSGVFVGKNVTVGHGAIVHGCRIADNVLVGMNATVLSGAEVGEWCIIAAGAVVLEGAKIPAKSLVAGVPAKVLREINEKDIGLIKGAAKNYQDKLVKMGKFE